MRRKYGKGDLSTGNLESRKDKVTFVSKQREGIKILRKDVLKVSYHHFKVIFWDFGEGDFVDRKNNP